MADFFDKWVLKARWIVILLTLGLVAAAGSGVRFLVFDTDYRVFFSEENPQLMAFEELQDTYTKNDNVLFILTPEDGRVFTPGMLRVVKDLTKASWQVPYSIRVDSITNFQDTRAEGDDLEVADLVYDPESLTPADLERIKATALAEPMLLHRLINPTASVTAVNVTVQLPGVDQQKEVPEVAAFVRAMADKVRAENPGLQVHLTGVSMMNNAFPEAAKGDMATLIPAMFLVVILTLGGLFRAVTGTITTIFVILFSIVAGMGLAGWMGIHLSGPTSAAPTIILTMGVADCVHILSTFYHGMRARGMDKRAAMAESLRVNLQPVFLTSVTTAIGFLSMNFSDAPPFRDLGNIVAMGVIAAFVWSVTFLPALMMVLPVKVKPRVSRTGLAMEKLGDFVVRRRNGLLMILAPLFVALIAFIPQNELNDEFVKYFDETIHFRVASDYAEKNLTGIYSMEYSLKSGEPGGLSDPEFLGHVEHFAQWLRSQPEVIHVNSITDTFKRLNKNLHGGDDAWYKLPEARDLAAQYLLLYEMSLPYGLDLNNQIDLDKSATRFTATLKNISTIDMLDLEARANSWLRKNAPASMHVEGSSPTVMFSHIGQRNIRSMLFGTTVALVVISFILVVALRSFKVGLISLIPNLIPAGLAFGLWGMLVGEVGLALSVVTGMSLGIVVDDTVHFLSKYLRARREMDLNSHDAVRYAFSTVGTALWVTSLVLVAGFFVLTYSHFKLNSDMGIVTAITISMALLADFLFLPPLLMKIEGDK